MAARFLHDCDKLLTSRPFASASLASRQSEGEVGHGQAFSLPGDSCNDRLRFLLSLIFTGENEPNFRSAQWRIAGHDPVTAVSGPALETTNCKAIGRPKSRDDLDDN